jgi:hypothetical protein
VEKWLLSRLVLRWKCRFQFSFVVLSFGRVGFDAVHVFDCNSLCEKSCPSYAMG